ncbi:MAG: hypothetical protein HY903_16675 [Deltaproteobacteria bacterium]|nr:hypothetical protein [Deltaproteobacteria bacterium]
MDTPELTAAKRCFLELVRRYCLDPRPEVGVDVIAAAQQMAVLGEREIAESHATVACDGSQAATRGLGLSSSGAAGSR